MPRTGPPATVRFETTQGRATFPGGLSTVDVLEGFDGYVSAPALTAGEEAGPIVVSASVVSSAVPSVRFQESVSAPTAGSISVLSGGGETVPVSPANVRTSFSKPLVVQVRDTRGQVLPSATVTFTAAGPAAFDAGSTVRVQTGPTGQATAGGLSAGRVAGAVTITAAVAGVSSSAVFTETVVARFVSLVVVRSGNNQSTPVSTEFSDSLVALALDQTNHIVPGALISFIVTGPATFAGASAVTVTANPEGVVTAPPLTATGAPGQVQIVATDSPRTQAATFTETVRNGAAALAPIRTPVPPPASSPDTAPTLAATGGAGRRLGHLGGDHGGRRGRPARADPAAEAPNNPRLIRSRAPSPIHDRRLLRSR